MNQSSYCDLAFTFAYRSAIEKILKTALEMSPTVYTFCVFCLICTFTLSLILFEASINIATPSNDKPKRNRSVQTDCSFSSPNDDDEFELETPKVELRRSIRIKEIMKKKEIANRPPPRRSLRIQEQLAKKALANNHA
jgi:hypothetical protein